MEGFAGCMKKRQKKKFVKRWHRRRREALRFHNVTALTADVSLLPESAEIFRSEMEYVIRCIADYPRIETGGELFGFWKDDRTPVVAYAIGPGPKANHQVAFFNQDIDYLAATGGVLTAKYGLEHIGEWHSHHRLGLPHPSGHDAATMAHGIRTAGRNCFLLCIGTCNDKAVSLGGFVFSRNDGESYRHVGWRVIGVDSPFRSAIDADSELTGRLVHPRCFKEAQHG